MVQLVVLLSCVLLSLSSSAPVPTEPRVPPGMIVEVEDTKTNVTLSFAIFILAEEEEEGSGTDGRGSSSSESDNITDDISSNIQPMASLPSTETETSSQPMKNKDDEESLSSEEMSDQPEVNVYSDDSDYIDTSTDDFNNSTQSCEVYSQPTVTASDDSDDNNNTRSDDFNDNSNSKETADPLPDDSGEFNNSTVMRSNVDPDSQEMMSSRSEKTSSVNQDGIGSRTAGISKDSGFGSRLQEVFRSIQEVVDLVSVNRGVMGAKGNHHQVLGSTPHSFTGSHIGFTLSSDESDQSSESVSSTSKNQTSSDPVSDEHLEATSYWFQQGNDSKDSSEQGTGPITSSISDRKEAQEPSVKSTLVDTSAILKPVSPDRDVAPTKVGILRDTVSQGSSRSSFQVILSVKSDSSEESQESVGTQEVVGSDPGLSKLSSSSEELLLVLSSSSSPLLVFSPDSGSKSDPPGLGSQSTEPSTDLNPTPGSDLSPEPNFDPSRNLNFSTKISQEQSEEPVTIKIPTDANSDVSKEANPTVDYRASTASIAVSSEASMEANPDSGVQDADSGHDVSIEADPTTAAAGSSSLPSITVSSGASTNGAKPDAGSELSVEENDVASTDTNADRMKPSSPTEHRANPPDSGASTDAIANVERELTGSDVSAGANPDTKSPGRNQNATSKENMTPPSPPLPPPSRKRPYRFGFLCPISHSHGNQPVAWETAAVRHHQRVYLNPLHNIFNSQYDVDENRRQQAVSKQAVRKQKGVSVAAAANPAQSSSEETS